MKVIDFHIHYTPEKFVKEKLGPGESPRTYFVNDMPAYSYHRQLYALDEHVKAMDKAGVDMAFLSSGAGLSNDLDQCRYVNDDLRRVEKLFPGKLFGLAHVPPTGGEGSLRELERAARELGYKGAAMASVVGKVELDSPDLWPFYRKANELGLFIFIHPALSSSGNYFDYDLGRSVGREFQLVLTTIRLINGGVLDEFPDLNFIISHLGGGISALMGRIEPYQDKEFWGTAGHPRHGKVPKKDFRYYFDKLHYDTGGFCGNINAVKCALVEIKPQSLVFGTDYPQEIRDVTAIAKFVEEIKALPLSKGEIDGILGENGEKILERGKRI